jgi:hypothetical protein
MCTFHTPFGRFMFLRMPFGISSASEIQQKKTCQTFGDIEGVHIVADDMLIAAENEEQHDIIQIVTLLVVCLWLMCVWCVLV